MDKVILDEIKALLAQFKLDIVANWDDNKTNLMNELSALQVKVQAADDKWALLSTKITVPGLEGTEKKFSFFKAIWAIKHNDWRSAGFEKEVFEATREKAMSMGSSSAGGYIVPTIYIPDLIELLSAEAVVARMGATMMPDLQGSPIQIPRQSAGTTAYWVGENSAITDSQIALEQLSMTPKKVGALVKLSNTLLRLSNPSAEALVRRDIALSLALAIDLAALRGTGSNAQPSGIGQQSSINTVAIGASGGALTFDHLIDMEYELAVDNALRGKLGYVFHPCIRRNLLKKKYPFYSGQTDGVYIVQPNPSTEIEFKNWLGYPYAMTTQVPINITKLSSGATLTEIYFANWQELLIGQWGGMEIMASQETSDAFEKDMTWVRILQELDIAVRHPQSFCLINDATATP